MYSPICAYSRQVYLLLEVVKDVNEGLIVVGIETKFFIDFRRTIFIPRNRLYIMRAQRHHSRGQILFRKRVSKRSGQTHAVRVIWRVTDLS